MGPTTVPRCKMMVEYLTISEYRQYRVHCFGALLPTLCVKVQGPPNVQTMVEYPTRREYRQYRVHHVGAILLTLCVKVQGPPNVQNNGRISHKNRV